MSDRFKFRVWDKVSKRYFFLELKFGDNGYHPLFIEKPIFEQCTGLKDKNGKLIYEGDIILVDDNKCPVEWDSENARYNVVGYGEIAYLNYNEIEIIGNINENADLLGENDETN